jgi:hypothetical protein
MLSIIKLNTLNHTRICRKFALTYPILIPLIISLSSYYDNTKQINTIHISGDNFRIFSTVLFDNSSIPFTFINSENISFDVPRNLSGSYPIQILNEGNSSNVVFYDLII